MIYNKVKELCKKKQLSICALEKQSGIGNGTIGRWKNSTPNLESLQAVADTLDVKVSDLLD